MAEIEQALNKKDIENLTDAVKEGFEGVHARQDKTNGNVDKNTKWRIYMTGGLALASMVGVPVVIFIIVTFIGKLI